MRANALRGLLDLATIDVDAQSRHAALRELRALHGTFTEGLDTADLRAARSLLAAEDAGRRSVTPPWISPAVSIVDSTSTRR